MASIEGILGIVSVGSATPVTLDELAEALKPSEMAPLRAFINRLMVEVGLGEEETGSDPLAAPSPSTAISTASSAPSSPGSDPLTGTA
jgi:hypothetical protein